MEQKNINNTQKIQKLQELVKEKKAKENKILTDAKKTRLSKEKLFQNSQYDFWDDFPEFYSNPEKIIEKANKNLKIFIFLIFKKS